MTSFFPLGLLRPAFLVESDFHADLEQTQEGAARP